MSSEAKEAAWAIGLLVYFVGVMAAFNDEKWSFPSALAWPFIVLRRFIMALFSGSTRA